MKDFIILLKYYFFPDYNKFNIINNDRINKYYLYNLLLNEKDIFFDIGANIGNETRIVLNLKKKNLVYCFEPNKKVFNILRRRFLNYRNVICFNKIVSNISKKIKFYYDPLSLSYSASISKKSYFYKYCDGINLNKFIIKNKINKIKLFKIDAERHDYQIISNIIEYCKKNKSFIIFESNKKKLLDKINYFKRNNYLIFDISNGILLDNKKIIAFYKSLKKYGLDYLALPTKYKKLFNYNSFFIKSKNNIRIN
jgi:FkbM family methyltransferase